MEILPTGIQSFSTIRENGMRYVDKTGLAWRLISRGRRYFLSRPRRFGKSLFVDTLQELFEGNEELFKGLAIHGQWDWSVRYPVIRFDFSTGKYSRLGMLEHKMSEMLEKIERMEGLLPQSTTLEGRFIDLIDGLREKAGQPVVVLVDEYDKPILGAIKDAEVVQDNRETLQSFYSVLKQEDKNIRFCLVSGVTQFSHVSMFSGANNLTDITLEPEYSTICGYTESELDKVFSEDLAGFDREEIRDWYNGYSWLGSDKVYNPYAILRLFESGRYNAWWYKTSTPTFLLEILKQRDVLSIALENIEITERDLDAFDVEDLSTAALLFQTGYLTIIKESRIGHVSTYQLGYPNREVRMSLNESLLRSLTSEWTVSLTKKAREIRTLFQDGEIEKLRGVLESVFAGIPYNWHATSQVANYEACFASVVYGLFVGASIEVRVEDATSEGRVDLSVIDEKNIFLFEFKAVNGDLPGEAIKQLRDKNYAEKYRRYGRPIHLVGIEFSKETKNVAAFNTELA